MLRDRTHLVYGTLDLVCTLYCICLVLNYKTKTAATPFCLCYIYFITFQSSILCSGLYAFYISLVYNIHFHRIFHEY